MIRRPPRKIVRLTPVELSGEIAKWYNNHTAAISLTYDIGAPDTQLDRDVQQAVLERGLHLDYELVTYNIWQEKAEYISEVMIPNGFQFFGHGHWHINHDQLSYERSKESFQLCYGAMTGLGITPVAYAYPGGHGRTQSTHQALADAGFLSGRMFEASDSRNNPYIMSNEETEPENWFALPSLVMMSSDFSENPDVIHDTAELIPFLEGAIKRRAWLITTYHAIGNPEG
ncbi:MAG: hypothetical protein D6675_05725 [Gemmatimonadetes bacterium]|nr:MAG: hypothetical protein D6675_05725 [Gemmatimonadota bacterium]